MYYITSLKNQEEISREENEANGIYLSIQNTSNTTLSCLSI